MSIDELIEQACDGDMVRLSYAPGVHASTVADGPGVYEFCGVTPGLLGTEVYLRVPGQDVAHRVTATWLSRAALVFEFEKAVTA